jgi:ketosteroid isomerase-like protein
MATVRDYIEPWCQACMDRDWDKLLSMCTADIVFMPHGLPPVSGDGVRPWLDSFPAVTAMSFDVESVEASEGIAFVRGGVQQTLQMEEGVHEVDGKYCDLMRREADGQWRFAVIIWNENRA